MVAERSLVQMGPQTMVDVQERDKLLRNLILPKATPEQFQLVLAICQRYGFDPLLRHVLIVSGNLYVTRDGLRHMAWQSGEFDGYDPPEERKGDDGKWVVTVKVYRKGIARPFTATAYQSEAENTNSPVWKSNPRLMTGKVAEVIALRMAFGVSVGGAEEIGFDDSNQTRIGEARFIETRVREVPPAQLAAPAATPEAESRFVATVRQMGADGVTVREISEFVNSEWDNLSEAEQLAGTDALDAIKAARRAAKAARQQQPAPPLEAAVVAAPPRAVGPLGDGSQRATERQVKFVYAIGQEAGLDEAAVNTLARGSYSTNVDLLNRGDAALLIEELQRQRNAGYQRPEAEVAAENALEEIPFD